MVWGCMSSHGVGRLHIVSGKVKAMDCIEILQNKLLPTARDFLGNQSWIFQYNNAPCHRAKNNLGSVSQNWFDFNDSRVSPIVVKDIEKQFSGKESAYMLFYRRKSFVRPLEAKGNPKYMMPERLLKLVEEENAELERQRDEYETALNTINLQVHLGNSYKCTNGVLEPKINEIHFVDLAIDKRKLLLDLRDCIFKLCSEIYPSQDFVLHTAREVPAGLHLYEELSECMLNS
ncbi:ubiquitin carboxyl-terminal hydrolase 40 [Trichonephila clavipes]|nr:ubiquitin carboxyl-terminal hydrolase 40 [Trichonephila clavipes]